MLPSGGTSGSRSSERPVEELQEHEEGYGGRGYGNIEDADPGVREPEVSEHAVSELTVEMVKLSGPVVSLTGAVELSCRGTPAGRILSGYGFFCNQAFSPQS